MRSQQFGKTYEGYKNNQTDLSIDNGQRGNYKISNSLLNKVDFKDYSYLAIWDMLDCKLAFYLSSGVGAVGGGSSSASVAAGAATAAAAGALSYVMGSFAVIFALLFGAQIILFMILTFYVAILVITIGWAVHLYIIASIAFSIIVFLSPIFLPMMLFQVTKNFFDSWLKEIMAYTLYPVMIFTFLALFISVFDKLYFGDLKFKSTSSYLSGSDGYNGKVVQRYVLDSSETSCKDEKFAANPYCIMSSFGIETKTFFGVPFNAASPKDGAKDMWKSMLMLSIIGYLFYNFFGLVGTIAAELTGSFRSDISRGTMTPDQVFAKGVEYGGKAIEMATGSGSGAVSKQLANRMEGNQGDKLKNREESDNDSMSVSGTQNSAENTPNPGTATGSEQIGASGGGTPPVA